MVSNGVHTWIPNHFYPNHLPSIKNPNFHTPSTLVQIDCKSAGFAFAGSNPALPTILQDNGLQGLPPCNPLLFSTAIPQLSPKCGCPATGPRFGWTASPSCSPHFLSDERFQVFVAEARYPLLRLADSEPDTIQLPRADQSIQRALSDL